MSNVIEDRTVLEVGNVQYVACIVQDEWQDNPLNDWDHDVSFYVPPSDRNTNHLAKLIDSTQPSVWTSDAPLYLQDAVEESYYDHSNAWVNVRLYRNRDKSGMYFAAQYNEDRYGGDAITVYWDDADAEREGGNLMVYVSYDTIRKNWNVKRITQAIRDNVRGVIESTLQTFNAWANGEVYGYYTLRQELDEDGETISSEEVNLWELGGDPSPTIYGYDGISELYDAAKVNAEYDHAAREATASHAMQSMDLFDAASYPEPTMSDVAGAYEARLNEQFAELGRVTRKLAEEGYHRGHGIIAIG